jgi:hypothetical protein
MDLQSDLGVYVGSGLFALGVFAVAVAVLLVRGVVEFGTGTVATFAVGFGLFISVYFVAMAIYRGIDSREEVS